MTSETETLKTNEFLRRRKLRLQQVREQSKDIAKKIRQRAKVETLRQVVDLDTNKQKEYFDRQEKLVKRLEVLYARGLNNVGASHQSASEVTLKDEVTKTDISKLRGKEAAAELRKKRQEKLDQQKKLLDRKLQAREAANELSREKTSAVANKLLPESKATDEIAKDIAIQPDAIKDDNLVIENSTDEQGTVTKNDMGTQWDVETMLNEWEPSVPALKLPIDDLGSLKGDDHGDNKTAGSKRLDLFALSEEMPSDLRGRHAEVSGVRDTVRPSLTLVSEYLQSRKLRLRETEAALPIKKRSEDMSKLKQTILRTRTTMAEVGDKGSIGTGTSKPESVLNKKNAVMMYNHVTRDTRDMTCNDGQFVVRDPQCSEDAYSQAMKEASSVHDKNKTHQKKLQDMRNKVAVTKQTVEKEYKDTINFLNSMPKDKGSKVSKVVFMDEHRQQKQNENRQHKMQQEYRKLEKECRKRHSCLNKSHNESRSQPKQNEDDDFDCKDFQYSWMPVPEGDGNLAIHTIPNTVKEWKSGNSVKFNQVDNYHEYRSRHKHTPPTKDTATHEKHSFRKRVEAVIIDKSASQSYGESSSISSSSSVDSLKLNEEGNGNQDAKLDHKSSDAERIIIYKILDTKNNKQSKRKTKLLSDIAKSLTSIEKGQKTVVENNSNQTEKKQIDNNGNQATKLAGNSVSFEQINEGVYKIAEDQTDNIPYFEHLDTNGLVPVIEQVENPMCLCKKLTGDQKKDKGTILQWEDGDNPAPTRTPKSSQYSSTSKGRGATPSLVTPKDTHPISIPVEQPSASTSSFKTVSDDKTNSAEVDFIKIVDEAGQEAGKFLFGAAGLLKDNAYEVVIQLRKKDGSKEEKKPPKSNLAEQTQQSGGESKSNEKVRSSNGEVFELANSESSHSKVTEEAHRHPESDEVLDPRSISIKAKESTILSPRITEQPHKLNVTAVPVESVDINDNTQDQTVSGSAFTFNDKIRLVRSSEATKATSDKGTNLEDCDPTPLSNPDPPSRPATTTYTQTTNSPIHRPIYFHMSSSTSTAYMSPPEMILPKFFRRDSSSNFETYGSKNIDTIYAKYGKNNKKCRHVKHTFSDMDIQGVGFKKNKISSPNSAMSCRNDYAQDTFDNLGEKKTGTPCRISRSDKMKCKCHKSTSSKDCAKKHCLRNKTVPVETYRSTLNVNMLVNRNINPKNKNKPASSASVKKSSLNPMVRNYINKLLALNKEGFKVIEVADQECSPVGTPGSSIINVPYNVDERKSSTSNKITFEQIKQDLLQQLLGEKFNNPVNYPQIPVNYPQIPVLYTTTSKQNNHSSWKPRHKPVHKVKSLNISKHLLKKNKAEKAKPTKPVSLSTTTDDSYKTFGGSLASGHRPRTSPSPGHSTKSISIYQQHATKKTNTTKIKKKESRNTEQNSKSVTPPRKKNLKRKPNIQYPSHKATITDTSLDSESTKESDDYYKNTADIPISMSTQTNQNMERDFVKLAENKLYNMEKIADLTEKCTKRLSNLAKVLEEVRRNKSLAYSQISASDSADSQADHKSDKEVNTRVPTPSVDIPNRLQSKSPESIPATEHRTVTAKERPHSEYMTILSDIPKFQSPEPNVIDPQPLNLASKLIRPIPEMLVLTDSSATEFTKCRPKPPPALSRIHLKHDQEYIVPHELSTVLEVDSPMSVKNKLQSSRNEAANNSNRSSNDDKEAGKDFEKSVTCKGKATVNPDLLQSNLEFSKQPKFSSTESSDDSKFQMIDLKHFNEIMLEPFISIQEYAKKYNVEAPDEGSNFEDLQRDDAMNEDMSSLHSDGSLPDVIAELLKRNIITEPFKFDTGSNVNSNTFSSESTLSMLALSKARKLRKRSSVMFQNKENIGETSDTLSFSSNPDLENAFKKLGMGWASSTLKKTKERLALSSSSNTSSSSLSQFKIKTFNQDIPALVTDSVSSVLLSKQGIHGKKSDDSSVNVEQQTSFANPMTVKDFLTNELANKITFTNNKSGMNDTEDEFVSLFETKMPEGFKQQSLVNREEPSNDSMRSGINRARTSTPVQIFKSMTYHSSTSSNVSNGLFSNVDDLSSVKMTSNSIKNHSTSDKDDLTIPNFSLKIKKVSSDGSKSD